MTFYVYRVILTPSQVAPQPSLALNESLVFGDTQPKLLATCAEKRQDFGGSCCGHPSCAKWLVVDVHNDGAFNHPQQIILLDRHPPQYESRLTLMRATDVYILFKATVEIIRVYAYM